MFNYSKTQNIVINYETRSLLFQYYNSSINIINLYPELFYCFSKIDVSEYRPKIVKDRWIKIICDFNFYERESISIKYFYKTFLLINNFKNKELIKSLNPFYYKIFKCIEFMYSKAKNYNENLKSIESKIFRRFTYRNR